ncbi:MAG: radical SAM protein [Candidatus Hatepunaea meridiana]|nr:radical SAM protein [Candidatus Hatepunaea meridiana]
MLKGIHFLLTYRCTNECDHCFLYCSPGLSGTFSISQVEQALNEAQKIGTVTQIYYEGGEPFLYYPLLLAGVRAAHERGFEVGIVTNSYWAVNPTDAEMWLKSLIDAGLTDLSVSDDPLHSCDNGDEKPGNAVTAAERLGLSVSSICIEKPSFKTNQDEAVGQEKGEPVIGGSTCFKGRAADKLTEGLPTRSWRNFNSCDREELVNPGRVHIDPFGNVHLCQGLSIGNIQATPLSELIRDYDAKKHPVCKHLIEGGPAQLATAFNVDVDDEYVDECHLCFNVRRKLIDRFPQYLAPGVVYGLI